MAMLDGIKSRFGLSKNEDTRNRSYGRNSRGYDDYDDNYDDYDDGYDDYADDNGGSGDSGSYNDGYESADNEYGIYAPVTTRSAGRSKSSPRLVSFDDVKEQTAQMTADRYAASTQRQTSSGAQRTSSSSASRTMPVGTQRVSSPATQRVNVSHERSEGLNSLFEPTASSDGSKATNSGAGKRIVSVIAPMTYNDVASVASVVRAKNVAVLDLKSTPESLRNRVLDFSFGVASALDAQVDSPAGNVYTIAKGEALSAIEKSTLKAKGVL